MKALCLQLVFVLFFFAAMFVVIINGIYMEKEQDAELRQQGHEAALVGVPVEACSHYLRGGVNWREGWIEGFKERNQKK